MLGIVILNYNTPEEVKSCIENIKKYTSVEYKIYVVDNCSTDNSMEYFYKHIENDCKIIKTDKNGGYSYGNNWGIMAAIEDKVDCICVMNPDIIVTGNALDLMYNFLCRSEKKIGVVASRIVTPEGTEGQCAYQRITLANYIFTHGIFARIQRLTSNTGRFLDWESSESDVYVFDGMVMGGCFLIRANVMEQIGCFDDSIFLYNEEDVLAYKLKKYNYHCAIMKNVSVIHNHHSSTSKEGGVFSTMYLRTSPLIVLRKYAQLNKMVYKIMLTLNRIVWWLQSLKRDTYRSRKKEFNKLIDKIRDIGVLDEFSTK